MAIEITSIREKRRLPRLKRPALLKARREAERARRRTHILHVVGITFGVAACAVLVTLFYLYQSYAKIVDERLASGYLTSRAGLYAAPRTLRKGQGITRDRLIQILKRAGYVERVEGGEASAVWSGRFTSSDDFV